MYSNKKIGVVVPAYNEEEHVGAVIRTMPHFVDRIYVVNDASIDRTSEIISNEAEQDLRVAVINRESRGGVGAAIMTGHHRALNEGMDVIAVMAGDGQMDPAVLNRFIVPIVENKADYVKGNRLSNREDRKEMPPWRLLGNFLLTSFTKFASGYWHVSDPQNGYTAISAQTLKKIDMDKIELGFAFENDILVKLNVVGARVMDIPHPAIYRGQKSKIRYGSFVLKTSQILLKDSIWRVWMKYFKGRPTPEQKPETQHNIAYLGRTK